ncbi:O-methyltransferase asqD [Hyphodiscus hymeniophilus]|uniref:O-methyltransferase asqD n=1 Tax=Hyphodiscus hymeniophilus TaxID=353542 RepID=A0A9P6VDR0_9HELO|nr:O-methyltransferase asqD [Hyphodiscus hymeniophilus]
MEALFFGCRYFPNILQTSQASKTDSKVSTRDKSEDHTKRTHPELEHASKGLNETETEDLKAIKQLYYQLHSLEQSPRVLPQARGLLLSLLKETSAKAQALPDHDSILSVHSFSRQELEDFQRRRDTNIGKEWEQYNFRRKEGGPRELFRDREEAIWWLKQISPVKYVDGAWLGHVGKVTTPFALQKTMKGAWQILFEELGDGDLEKNHVHLYHKLLGIIAPGFPTAEELDFGHSRHQLDDLGVWKSAIAQLLVSLFPSEFLPEILGFNLHFEAISMDTLKAGMELKEVGIDPYYFILHISIDNAHSGHSAIAIEIVCEYMDHIRKYKGEAASQRAWQKIQAGYLLSSGLPGTTVCPSKRRLLNNSTVSLSPTETEVMKIFMAKAQVVHGIHCSSRVRIGSRSVADWLDPVALESKDWQMDLLNALSSSKYWICRGDSSRSRFMQELQWNGRMFGSFTQDEYDALKNWVDHLPNVCGVLEGLDTVQATDYSDEDILSGNPTFQTLPSGKIFEITSLEYSATTVFSVESLPAMDLSNRPIVESFLPLWFSHPCLLRGFISVPFKTKTNFACTIIKILRAQGGFDIEQECVAGMGEVRRPNSLGLAGIGMNMMVQQGVSLDELIRQLAGRSRVEDDDCGHQFLLPERSGPEMSSISFSLRIDELATNLTTLVKEITSREDDSARKKLLDIVKEQAMILESPVEFIWRIAMEPHQHASLRTAIEMKLTDLVVSGPSPVTADSLAKSTGGDKLLIVRIMRPLTCMKVFDEVGFETYTWTPISKFLTMPSSAGCYKFMFDQLAKACVHIPTFLSQTSYANPSGTNGNFQSAFSTTLQFFPWLIEHPDQMVHFNDFIAVKPVSRVEWYDFVPIQKLLLQDFIEGTALLVDIGGNRGLNLEGFKQAFPQIKAGSLILQDLPNVIDDIKELDEGIVRMKHDFFTAQPVIGKSHIFPLYPHSSIFVRFSLRSPLLTNFKGARAYYLRYILHDHSDAVCRTILSHIVTAMRGQGSTVATPRSYSKLLIFEYVLPDVGAALFPTLLDITMLALLNGMERTEMQWKELLESVGLEAVKFWYNGGDRNHEALIEARLSETQ